MFAKKCSPLNSNFKQQHELHKKEKQKKQTKKTKPDLASHWILKLAMLVNKKESKLISKSHRLQQAFYLYRVFSFFGIK